MTRIKRMVFCPQITQIITDFRPFRCFGCFRKHKIVVSLLFCCDFGDVAKHHIYGKNYSNYDNFFPIKAHRCSGRHGGYFSGRHGSLPLQRGATMEMEGGFYGDGSGLLKWWSGAFMVVEVCYLSVGDVLLWRWSGALWGARGVLCRGKEQCFTGDDTPVIQSFICGEKREGVPPWGLTNLIRCDISEIAKRHILGRNYSNYFNFFPIKVPQMFGQTRGLFFGQTRESAPTRAPKAIQTPLPSGGVGGGLFPLGRGRGWAISPREGLGWASSSGRASWAASATCCSRRCGGCCLQAGAAGRCRRAGG